jgi:hypothetical protein
VGFSVLAFFHFLVYPLSSLKQSSELHVGFLVSRKEISSSLYLLLVGVFLGFSSSVLFCAVLGYTVFWVRVLCFKPASIQRGRIGCGGVGLCIFDKP